MSPYPHNRIVDEMREENRGGHEQRFDQHGQVGNVLELAPVV